MIQPPLHAPTLDYLQHVTKFAEPAWTSQTPHQVGRVGGSRDLLVVRGGGLDLVERVGLVADPYRESDPFPWWQGGTTTWLETREEQINRAPHWSKACWGFKLVKRRAVELGRWGEGWTRGELS